ncbi:MAG TPA: hypothetical protein PKE64_17770 [Anaerolineae bacterium]|nr:hypothetical protein [Anaerolineae bacterium]HMR65860.1 hypothetical protein [Anaerolineae bacterium]
MNRVAIKPTGTSQENLRCGPYIFAVIIFTLIIVAFFDPIFNSASSSLFIAGLMLGLALVGLRRNLEMAKHKKQQWRELSQRTKLDCQVGGAFLGYPVYLEGFYRNRPTLVANNTDKGIFQIPATRIEVGLTNANNASLRLRGPYPTVPTDRADEVVHEILSASRLKEVSTDKRRFYVGASYVHLTTNLFSFDNVRDKLNKLQQPVSIVLDRQKLYFEHPGIIYDTDYLCLLLDLLNDLAAAIERTANTRLMLAAGSR